MKQCILVLAVLLVSFNVCVAQSKGTLTTTQAILSNATNQRVLANSVTGRLLQQNANNIASQGGGLVINPFTGQAVNTLANPFNTGIVLNPNFANVSLGNATMIQTGIGNLAAFPTNGTFPNGVSLNVNFPLNVTTTTGTLSNTNQNLTGGSGSTGIIGIRTFTSASATNSPAAGVRFPTLTLGATAAKFSAATLVHLRAVSNGSSTTTGLKNTTKMNGIVQRKDGTFTNAVSKSSNR